MLASPAATLVTLVGAVVVASPESTDQLIVMPEALTALSCACTTSGNGNAVLVGADWPLPERDTGFYRSFLALYRQPFGPPEAWQAGLTAELSRLADQNIAPLYSIVESLDLLGVPENEWKDYIIASLLARTDWHGRLLNGSDYPLPGVVPLVSLQGLVDAQLLDATAVKPLTRLRDSNVLLFDFVLKRSLRKNGQGFAATVFETAPFFTQPAGSAAQ